MDMIEYIEREYNSSNIFINNIDKIIKECSLVSIDSLEELELFNSKMRDSIYDIDIYEEVRRAYPIYVYLRYKPTITDYRVIKMEVDYYIYSDSYYKALNRYGEEVKSYKLNDILYISI